MGWAGLEGLRFRRRRGSSPAGWVGAFTTWLRLFFFFRSIFFFSSRFYLEAAPGRPRRNVTHQPARRGFGQKERSSAASSTSQRAAGTSPGPLELLRYLCAPSGRPSRPRLRTTSGVGCKESLRLPPPAASQPLGLGGSPPAPAPALSLGLARDRVPPRTRHHEQALHRQPKRERDPRRLGESVCGAQDLLQRPVLGQIRLCFRGLPRRALGDEGHRNFLG